MKVRDGLLVLLMLGLVFADLTISPDQPICKLYGMIRFFGTIVGVLMAAYSGFVLASSHEMSERNSAKGLIAGVVIGLIIIWLAPLIVTNLVGSGAICGWSA